MLKVYVVKSWYKVDDEQWKRGSRHGYMIREETTEEGKLHFHKASWDEVYDKSNLADIWVGQTLFRRRPYIEVHHGWDDTRRFYRGDFREFTYMDSYDEWKECSLEWIMKHASAEQAIQYMKERGMTVCPMQ